MANEIEKVNSVAIASIEKISSRTEQKSGPNKKNEE